MQLDWTIDEIIDHFTLREDEHELIKGDAPHNQLGKALLLKFFQYAARFPENQSEIPLQAVDYIAQQLGLSAAVFAAYKWQGRSIKAHRQAIRERLGFRPATMADQAAWREWLVHAVLPDEHRPRYLEERVYDRLRHLQIEPPS